MNTVKSLFILIAVIIATFLALPAQAQTGDQAIEAEMDEIRRTVIQKRDSALSILIEMNEEQAAAFWPLQKSYDKDLEKLGKEDHKLGRDFQENYDKLTAESAADIAERFFKLERERLTLQQSYFKKISEAVSPVIAVQFIQLQRQFETEIRMARMKATPLAK